MRVDRRTVLSWGLAGACACLPGVARAALSDAGERKLAFLNLHTGETLDTTYWADGGYIPESLSAIDRVLRDHRSGEVERIDPRLLDLLHSLQGRMESKAAFHVISGYRSPNTNSTLRTTGGGGVAKKSLHMRGMAIDIRLPGHRLLDLHRAAKSLKQGGVGLYRTSDFVHVDVGRVRYW